MSLNLRLHLKSAYSPPQVTRPTDFAGIENTVVTVQVWESGPRMECVDCLITGAGVVGLAVARALALAGREVLVVEEAAGIGTGTSSRNSEVIHAGIYYEPGSLKAQLCVKGRDQLYRYCEERDIGHRRAGKMIVASSNDQVPKLERLLANADACGVNDLRLITEAEAQSLEPNLQCAAAVISPSTGIIDSHGLMTAFRSDAEDASAAFAFLTTVTDGWIADNGIVIRTVDASGNEYRLKARRFVNAAGLNAQALASSIKGFPQHRIPALRMARGCYFTLKGRSPFSHLIYPIPTDGGLGIHLTLDLTGQARFGPDVEWIDSIDYSVDEARSRSFYQEIRRYWPGLGDDSLQPGYAGIRPKLSGPGEPPADFAIQGPAEHGIDNLVNLFGIESPGLTASLAIADVVAGMLLRS